MRLATISKRFTFHAAHRLPNHAGMCRGLHGHSYVLEVAVTGRVKDADGSSSEGMVIDFQELKAIYASRIEPRVEHQFLNETLRGFVPETDREEVDVRTYGDADERTITGAGTPLTTAENIATWIHDVFVAALEPATVGGPITNVQVTLWETPTSSATIGKAWRG
jgi:6-pyruvoyltetrahydropterin/6-carboxytetrahydropterin synthase